MKLSDAHLILLSAAAQRDDHAIELPPDIEPVAAEKLVAKLAGAGLIEEIEADGLLPIWRRLDDAAFALRITEDGLKAIGVEAASRTERSISNASAKDNLGANAKPRKKAKVAGTSSKTQKKSGPKVRAAGMVKPARGGASRSGTKLDHVKNLLARKGGATIQDMMDATDWQPHTTRAVLTGFRKRGFGIEREAAKGKPTIYRIVGGYSGGKKIAGRHRKGA